MLEIQPQLKKVIDDILAEKGFVALNYDLNLNRIKGDGFTADVFRVEVEKKRIIDGLIDGKITFAIKKEPLSSAKRKEITSDVLFGRESLIYGSFIPAIQKLLKDKESNSGENVKEFINSPIYFSTVDIDNSSSLIFEDMKMYGYQHSPIRVQLNENWCQRILEQLARFHACSFVMKHQQPEIFNSFRQQVTEVLFKKIPVAGFDKYMGDKMKEFVIMMLECFDSNSKYMLRLREFGENTFFKLHLIFEDFCENNDYGVICHGDYWTNNMLFIYTEENLEKVCMLDFQVSRYSSPVTDLSYFLCICADLHLFKNLHSLLDHYYECLFESIKLLGSDPTVLYPKSVFQEQLKKFFRYGLAMSASIVPLLASDTEDIPDVHNAEKNGDTNGTLMDHLFKHECKNKELVQNHLKTVLKCLVDNDFL